MSNHVFFGAEAQGDEFHDDEYVFFPAEWLNFNSEVTPPKTNMEPENGLWKRRFLLGTIISRFHVNFWGCTSCFSLLASHLLSVGGVFFGVGQDEEFKEIRMKGGVFGAVGFPKTQKISQADTLDHGGLI